MDSRFQKSAESALRVLEAQIGLLEKRSEKEALGTDEIERLEVLVKTLGVLMEKYKPKKSGLRAPGARTSSEDIKRYARGE